MTSHSFEIDTSDLRENRRLPARSLPFSHVPPIFDLHDPISNDERNQSVLNPIAAENLGFSSHDMRSTIEVYNEIWQRLNR